MQLLNSTDFDITIRRCNSIIAKNKETLPEGVLSIVIRAHFWQPQKNDRKAE